METWDAVRARRNVREFTAEPLDADGLDRILEAGRLAPSARNWQPWDFVLVTDPAVLGRLADVWVGARHVAGAQAAIVVVSPLPEDERQREWLWYDVGQATLQMMLVAADLGIGTGHSAVENQELARELLGFPAESFASVLFSLGRPAGMPLAPGGRRNRRSFAEVVHRERW